MCVAWRGFWRLTPTTILIGYYCLSEPSRTQFIYSEINHLTVYEWVENAPYRLPRASFFRALGAPPDCLCVLTACTMKGKRETWACWSCELRDAWHGAGEGQHARRGDPSRKVPMNANGHHCIICKLYRPLSKNGYRPSLLVMWPPYYAALRSS